MRLSIQKKILLGFTVVVVLSTSIALGAYFSLTVVQNVLDSLRPNEIARDKIRDTEQLLRDTEHHLDQYLTVGGEGYRRQLSDDNANMEISLNDLMEIMKSDTLVDIKELSAVLSAGESGRHEIAVLLSLDLQNETAGHLNGQILRAYKRLGDLSDALDVLRQRVKAYADTQVASARAVIKKTTEEVLYFMFFLIIFAIAISVIISRTLTRPIHALISAASQIAAGAHGARAPVISNDEIGKLAIVFNQMANTLESYTTGLEQEVATRTKELSEKMERINNANEELDHRAMLLVRRDNELSVANEKLLELDEIKSEFLSVAAHQLRTPLSAIKWIISVLLEGHMGALSTEQKSYLLKGEESNNRMIRLVDDMLTVTRIESGKTEYQFYKLSLNEILKNLLNDFSPRTEEQELKLNYHEESKNLEIMVDPEKIRYVFENLLENAMRYTPSGGSIDASLKRDGKMCIVTIKDTGIGIPLKEQKNIFSKFFRATNAIKKITDGSGLGLFVAKNTVERHGGTISFESSPENGTTFIVNLPLADTSAVPQNDKSADSA